MESKLSWDDIPSLDELVMDWEYKSEIALDKRAFVRIAKEEMSQLYESGEIIAKLATAKQTYDGHLFDISAGGIALSLPVLLAENLPVKVGFFLGTTRIVSKGIVRYVDKSGNQYKTGIKFLDLTHDSFEYIAGLHAANVLLRAR